MLFLDLSHLLVEFLFPDYYHLLLLGMHLLSLFEALDELSVQKLEGFLRSFLCLGLFSPLLFLLSFEYSLQLEVLLVFQGQFLFIQGFNVFQHPFMFPLGLDVSCLR